MPRLHGADRRLELLEPAAALAWLLIEIALGRGMLEPSVNGAQLKEVSAEDRKQLLKHLLRPQ